MSPRLSNFGARRSALGLSLRDSRGDAETRSAARPGCDPARALGMTARCVPFSAPSAAPRETAEQRAPSRARSFALVTLAFTATLAGCDFGRTVVPEGRDGLVVHAVLNPAVSEQVILVERALTGRNAVDETAPYDSLDPIVSGGGVPVSGARVVVYGPRGDSAVAVEDRAVRADRRGAGAYRVRHVPAGIAQPAGGPLITLTPGGSYRLRVSSGADVVNGETTIPASPPRNDIVVQPFNRDRDSVFIAWNPVDRAARYVVRIASPRGAFQLFVDDVEYLVAGALSNTSQVGLPNVFVPGFFQRVQVAAVDSNFHDYYRSGSDRFTGRGLLTRLQGGTGLFGSYVLLRTIELDVTADRAVLVEGSYRIESGAGPGIPSGFTIYAEYGGQGPITRLSGNYSQSVATTERHGVLGSFVVDQLTLAMLRGQTARDTALVLEGKLLSTVFTATVRGTNQRVTYRRFN